MVMVTAKLVVLIIHLTKLIVHKILFLLKMHNTVLIIQQNKDVNFVMKAMVII